MKRLSYLTLAVVIVLGLIANPVMAKSYKGSKKAWLGVYTQTVDYDLSEAFELPVKYGVVINEVVDDSPADEAGLKEDDVIIRVDGSKITDSRELVEMIDESRPGDEITLTIMRDNKELELAVTLGKRPGQDKSIWITNGPYSKTEDYFFSMYSDQMGSYIGVSMLDLTRQLGDFFGIDKGRGALIIEVREDSPAEEAGLKAGDVIVAIDKDEVIDSDDVQDLISEKEAGDKVEVTVVRNKKERTFTIEVAEDEDSPQIYSFRKRCTPDISIDLPDIKGLLHGIPSVPEWDDDDLEKFELEMKKLKKELKSLQKEMQELREKLD